MSEQFDAFDDAGFGFDAADSELAAWLLTAAPPAGDSDAALDGLRPRFARARRRRQAGFAAVGVLALAVLVSAVLAVTSDSRPGAKVNVPPAHRSTEAPPGPTTPIPAPGPSYNRVERPEAVTTPTASIPKHDSGGAGSSSAPVGSGSGDDHGGGSNSGPGSTGSGSSSGSGSSGSSGSDSGSGSGGSVPSSTGSSGSSSSGSGDLTSGH